jgi:hypothetical protein
VPFHVRITSTDLQGRLRDIVATDKDAAWVETRIVEPRKRGESIFVDGQTIAWPFIESIRIIETDRTSEQMRLDAYRTRAPYTSESSEWYAEREGRDVTDTFLSGPPGETVDSSAMKNQDRIRKEFLERLYEETGGTAGRWVDPTPIGVRIGLDTSWELSSPINWNVRAGFIETESYDDQVCLTDAGVREIDRIRSRETETTKTVVEPENSIPGQHPFTPSESGASIVRESGSTPTESVTGDPYTSNTSGGGGRNAVESPATSAEAKVWSFFFGILGFIATIAGILTAVWPWEALRTDTIRAFTVAGLIILAATLASLAARLRSRDFSLRLIFDLIIFGSLCICGATAVTLYTQWMKPPPSHPVNATATYIRIGNLREPSPNAPAPLVCWKAKISGTAVIPAGDVLVLGITPLSPRDWYFQPNVSRDQDTWSATVPFGQPSDNSHFFQISVFAIPKEWEKYVDSLFNAADPKAGGGWIYKDIPSPSVDLVEETVQRTSNGC